MLLQKRRLRKMSLFLKRRHSNSWARTHSDRKLQFGRIYMIRISIITGRRRSMQKQKRHITKNQGTRRLSLYTMLIRKNYETLHQNRSAIKIPFTLQGKQEIGISADDSQIYWNGEPFVNRSIIKLPGQHNLRKYYVCNRSRNSFWL